MSVPPAISAEETRKAVDRFAGIAYTCPALVKFIQIAVDTFDRKGTMKLTMDIKAGETKGGNGNFSF